MISAAETLLLNTSGSHHKDVVFFPLGKLKHRLQSFLDPQKSLHRDPQGGVWFSSICPLFPRGQGGMEWLSHGVLYEAHFSHLAWEVLNFAGHFFVKGGRVCAFKPFCYNLIVLSREQYGPSMWLRPLEGQVILIKSDSELMLLCNISMSFIHLMPEVWVNICFKKPNIEWTQNPII